MSDIIRDDGSRVQSPIKDPRIMSINRLLEEGKSDIDLCLKHCLELKAVLLKELSPKRKRVFNEDNYQILDDFFSTRYRNRRTKDRTGAYHDFRRAVDAVGMLPLRTVTVSTLQDELARLPVKRQRRVISRLNSIFKFLQRFDMDIHMPKKPQTKVRHLTEKEWLLVQKKLRGPHERILCQLAFSSGCRLGEIFALEEDDYRNGVLSVSKQLLVPKRAQARGVPLIQPTKNERDRRLIALPDFDRAFTEWLALSYEERLKLRTKNMARVIKSACEEVFPNKPNKHVVFHDLRHSYAIALLDKGVPMKRVAECLGDSVVVCEEHYAGFDLSDESVLSLRRLIR